VKIDDFTFRNLPQELIDFKDKVVLILNLGKYQKTIISSPPNWVARAGEEVYTFAGTTGRLYVCSSDNTAIWSIVSTFTL
jgi:hypothetical protein